MGVGFGAPSLKGQALRWLAQREHTRAELKGKLLRALVAADRDADRDADRAGDHASDRGEQINRLRDELTAAGFLSDTRAAESLLQVQGRRFGSRRLQQVMRERGVPADVAAPALQQARATEFDRAREVWQRRFGQAAADAAERARQMRFLAGRGFDSEVIRRVVGRAATAGGALDDD